MAEADNIKDNSSTQKNGPNGTNSPVYEGQAKPAAEQAEKKTSTVSITDLELEQLRREAADYKDKYFRVLAESENARKRMQKERQELIQYAVQNVIVDFLNPIDHLENALNFAQQASDEVKHWAHGFQMILNQFKDTLANNGVVAIKSEGTTFDPHFHEAIEMVETADYPPGTIVTETLKGYRMGDKTIRPARVKVAKAPALNENNQNL
jgi:molecular chaperone GrpE